MLSQMPTDYDLEPFVGCELVSVLACAHHVELRFLRTPHVVDGEARTDECSLAIEDNFVFTEHGAPAVAFNNENIRFGVGLLATLIQSATVTSVATINGRGLLFAFSNGATVEVLASPDGYESYHLQTASGSITV